MAFCMIPTIRHEKGKIMGNRKLTGFLRNQNTLYDIKIIGAHHYIVSKLIEHAPAIETPKVISGLGVTMMCQCRFISCH